MMLPTIPTPDELLDKGFRRGKKAADLRRGEKMPKHLKGKRIEETRVITACQVIKDRLKMILDRTPEIEELPEFYQDYIDITVGVDDFKQALGALNWAYGIITQLEKEYGAKIRKSSSERATGLRKQAYGRISSVVHKIEKDLDFLDFAKQSLRNMPTVDFDAISIVIAGFPNVGKSTLLTHITDAEPQVANYPFTTKGIQIGHFEKKWQHYQIIDTPGLLDIFDGSETCGYLLENQYNLLEEIQNVFDAPIIYLFNKMDIAEYDGIRHDYVQQYIDKCEDPLLISAAEGEGIEEIIDLIMKVEKRERVEEEEEYEDDENYFDLT